MSMKRNKQRSSGGSRDKDQTDDPWAKPAQPEKTWEELVEGKADGDFVPYLLSERFAKGQFIHHAKFGKGVIVDADTSRIEILFQEGKKKLGHGQTA